jgi:hypothetical protein
LDVATGLWRLNLKLFQPLEAIKLRDGPKRFHIFLIFMNILDLFFALEKDVAHRGLDALTLDPACRTPAHKRVLAAFQPQLRIA